LLLAGCLASFAVVATMIFNWVLSVSLILLLAEERERERENKRGAYEKL
jgi:hypothetical protein